MTKLKNVRPEDITIDKHGRVIISDPKFAEQLKKRLASKSHMMNPLCIDLDCIC